ncbi:hypothetical protein EF847_00600 [Actinobacteria bacterium YIM 96077]|uniref:Membrane-associated oxidoreductase n=1 Tax=Phytoactinopolyspora halophila TaxID=1981511 RepID=A0A329R1K5_9ACTN|nr:hypothetical protein [Phytoactinopolyspora halophila]AYY11442.1 hypothetical protein EF847_00600 [Actinobacteria bacterium YIM 96077]RAW18076.1 hypothetical protein DPM12_04405 [Phytoactinopolyspora halophila]
MVRERLQSAEKALRDAVELGDEAILGLDIDPRALTDPEEIPEERIVRADVLAEMLRDDATAHGAGVRLTGARITGDMFFRYGTLKRPLRLSQCWIDDLLTLADLTAAGVELIRCRLPAIRTESVDITGSFTVRECRLGMAAITDTRVHRSMSLEDSRIVRPESPLRTRNLTVWGDLLLDRTRLYADDGQAWHAERLSVGGRLGLAGLRARGAITLAGAPSVDGRIDMAHAVIRNGTETALDARRLTAAGIDATAIRCSGTFDLRNATIAGTVALNEAVLACPDGYALRAGDISADRIELEKGARVWGGVSIPRTAIRDTLAIRGLSVRDTGGRALVATGASITNLVADDAWLDGQLVLDELAATYVGLTGSHVRWPDGDGSVNLKSAVIRRELDCRHMHNEGTLNVYGARVGTVLDLRGALLEQPGGRSLAASRVHVGGRLTLVDGFRARGEIDLAHADIGKSLAMDGTQVEGKLRLFRARVRSDVLLREARVSGSGVVIDAIGLHVDGRITARNMVCLGAVRMTGAITDSLALTGARFVNPQANALIASRIQVGGDVIAGDDPYSSNAGSFSAEGRVILHDASIGGDLILDGAVLTTPHHFALECTGVEVGGKISLQHAEIRGTAGLDQAQVRRRIVVRDARFIGDGVESADGPVVLSAMQTTSNDLLIKSGFFGGAIRLSGSAFVSGVSITETSIQAGDHAALLAADITCGVFRLSNVTTEGVIVLARSRIDGDLECLGMSAGGRNRPVIIAREAHVARRISLDGVEIVEQRERGRVMDIDLSAVRAGSVELPQGKCAVDLRNAEIRTLVLDPSDTTTVLLSGLTFDDPGGADVETALAWLRRDPEGYQHQAYEQLAAHYRRIGDDAAARTVLLARQRHRRDLLKRSSLGHVMMKTWGYLQDVMVGYGYRPGLAAMWFAGLLAFGTFYFNGRDLDPVEVEVHPTFHPLGYTIDLLVPVIKLGQAMAWDPQGLDLFVSYSLIFMGAVLVTTIGAAVTRVLGRR